jgi:hypothetical protein
MSSARASIKIKRGRLISRNATVLHFGPNCRHLDGGIVTRLSHVCSPHEAQRNAGARFPDYASRHPGYRQSGKLQNEQNDSGYPPIADAGRSGHRPCVLDRRWRDTGGGTTTPSEFFALEGEGLMLVRGIRICADLPGRAAPPPQCAVTGPDSQATVGAVRQQTDRAEGPVFRFPP